LSLPIQIELKGHSEGREDETQSDGTVEASDGEQILTKDDSPRLAPVIYCEDAEN